MRSSAFERAFVSTSSCFTVPCSTLNRFTWPTYGIDDRLEHERAGLAAVERGRGRFLDEERRQPVDADELRRAAAQHREHAARRDARGERARELGDVDRLVAEVALHEVVVADDDAFDERVVHRVLFGLHLVGDRAFGALRGTGGVGDGDVVQEIDDARRASLLRRSAAAAARHRRRTSPSARRACARTTRARGRAC